MNKIFAGEKITHYTVTSGSASFNTFAEYDDAKTICRKNQR